jgi:hypothetical protein
MHARYDFVMRLLESIGVKVKKPMILEVDNTGSSNGIGMEGGNTFLRGYKAD